jgi:hypothetical protein
LGYIQCGEFFDSVSFSRRTLLHAVSKLCLESPYKVRLLTRDRLDPSVDRHSILNSCPIFTGKLLFLPHCCNKFFNSFLCKITSIIHKFCNASKMSCHETLDSIHVEAISNRMVQHKELI